MRYRKSVTLMIALVAVAATAPRCLAWQANLGGNAVAHVTTLGDTSIRTSTAALLDGPVEVAAGRLEDPRSDSTWGGVSLVHTMGGSRLRSRVGIGMARVDATWPHRRAWQVQLSVGVSFRADAHWSYLCTLRGFSAARPLYAYNSGERVIACGVSFSP